MLLVHLLHMVTLPLQCYQLLPGIKSQRECPIFVFFWNLDLASVLKKQVQQKMASAGNLLDLTVEQVHY